MQAIAILFLVEILECGLVPSRQPDGHHLAITGLLGPLHDDNIAVIYHGVDHRFTVDFEGKQIHALLTHRQQAASHIHPVDLIADVGFTGCRHLDRQTSRDRTEDGNFKDVIVCGTAQAQCAGKLGIPFDVAPFFELLEIISDNRGGRNIGCLADLTNRRRITFALPFSEIFEDFLMPLC